MAEPIYHDRQNLENWAWPELREVLVPVGALIRGPGEVAPTLKSEFVLVSSIAAGCLHCQAGGAYCLDLEGIPLDRILGLWDFEHADLFDDAELAAFRLARDGSVIPNAVTPAHFEALRRHYTDRQIVEFVAVLAITGFMNRWNDTVAVVTDQASIDWAELNLQTVDWEVGKHKGAPEEQRSQVTPYMLRVKAESGS